MKVGASLQQFGAVVLLSLWLCTVSVHGSISTTAVGSRGLLDTLDDFPSEAVTLNEHTFGTVSPCEWQFYTLSVGSLPVPLQNVYTVEVIRLSDADSAVEVEVYVDVGTLPRAESSAQIIAMNGAEISASAPLSCTIRSFERRTATFGLRVRGENSSEPFEFYFKVATTPITIEHVELDTEISAALGSGDVAQFAFVPVDDRKLGYVELEFSDIVNSDPSSAAEFPGTGQIFLKSGDIAGGESTCDYSSEMSTMASNSTYVRYRIPFCALEGKYGTEQFLGLFHSTDASPVTFKLRVTQTPTIVGVVDLNVGEIRSSSILTADASDPSDIANTQRHFRVSASGISTDYLSATVSDVSGGAVTFAITQGGLPNAFSACARPSLAECSTQASSPTASRFPACTVHAGFPGTGSGDESSGNAACVLDRSSGDYFLTVAVVAVDRPDVPVTFNVRYEAGNVLPMQLLSGRPVVADIRQNAYHFYELRVDNVDVDTVLDISLYTDSEDGGPEVSLYVLDSADVSAGFDGVNAAGPQPCLSNTHNETHITHSAVYHVPQCRLEVGQVFYISVYGGGDVGTTSYEHDSDVSYTLTASLHGAASLTDGMPDSSVLYSGDTAHYALRVPSSVPGQRVDVELLVADDDGSAAASDIALHYYVNYNALAGDIQCCYSHLYHGSPHTYRSRPEAYPVNGTNGNECMYARAGVWYIAVVASGGGHDHSRNHSVAYTVTATVRQTPISPIARGVWARKESVGDFLFQEYRVPLADTVEVTSLTVAVNNIHGSVDSDSEAVEVYIQRNRPATNWCYDDHHTFGNTYTWNPTGAVVSQSELAALQAADPAGTWSVVRALRTENTYNISGCDVSPGAYYIGVTAAASDYYAPVNYDIQIALAGPDIRTLTLAGIVAEDSADTEVHYRVVVADGDFDGGDQLAVTLSNVRYGEAQMYITYGGIAGPRFESCRPTQAYCRTSTSVVAKADECTAVVPQCALRSAVWYVMVNKLAGSSGSDSRLVNYNIVAQIVTPDVKALELPATLSSSETSVTVSATARVGMNELQHFSLRLGEEFDTDTVRTMRIRAYMDGDTRLGGQDNGLRVYVNHGAVAGRVPETAADTDGCGNGRYIGTIHASGEVDVDIPYCMLRSGDWYISVFGVQDAGAAIYRHWSAASGNYGTRASFTVLVTIATPVDITPSALNADGLLTLHSVSGSVSTAHTAHYKLDLSHLDAGRHVTLALRNVAGGSAIAHVNPGRLAGDCRGDCPYFSVIDTGVTSDQWGASVDIDSCAFEPGVYYVAVSAVELAANSEEVSYTLTTTVGGNQQASLHVGSPLTGERVNMSAANSYIVRNAAHSLRNSWDYMYVDVSSVEGGSVSLYASTEKGGQQCASSVCNAGTTEQRDGDAVAKFYDTCTVALLQCLGQSDTLYITVRGNEYHGRNTSISYSVRAMVKEAMYFREHEFHVDSASVSRILPDVYVLTAAYHPFGTIAVHSYGLLEERYIRAEMISGSLESSEKRTLCTSPHDTCNTNSAAESCTVSIGSCAALARESEMVLIVHGHSSSEDVPTGYRIAFDHSEVVWMHTADHVATKEGTLDAGEDVMFAFYVYNSEGDSQFSYEVHTTASGADVIRVYANTAPAGPSCHIEDISCATGTCNNVMYTVPACQTTTETYYILLQNRETTQAVNYTVTAREILPTTGLELDETGVLEYHGELPIVDSHVRNSMYTSDVLVVPVEHLMPTGDASASLSFTLASSAGYIQLSYSPMRDAACCHVMPVPARTHTVEPCEQVRDAATYRFIVSYEAGSHPLHTAGGRSYTLTVRRTPPPPKSHFSISPTSTSASASTVTIGAGAVEYIVLDITDAPAHSAYWYKIDGGLMVDRQHYTLSVSESSVQESHCVGSPVHGNQHGWTHVERMYENGTLCEGSVPMTKRLYLTLVSSNAHDHTFNFAAGLVLPSTLSLSDPSQTRASLSAAPMAMAGIPLLVGLHADATFSVGSNLTFSYQSSSDSRPLSVVARTSTCGELGCYENATLYHNCAVVSSDGELHTMYLQACAFPMAGDLLFELVDPSAQALGESLSTSVDVVASGLAPTLMPLRLGYATPVSGYGAARKFFTFDTSAVSVGSTVVFELSGTTESVQHISVTGGSPSFSSCMGHSAHEVECVAGETCRMTLPVCAVAHGKKLYITTERMPRGGTDVEFTVRVVEVTVQALSASAASSGFVYSGGAQMYKFEYASTQGPETSISTATVTVRTDCAGDVTVSSFANHKAEHSGCSGDFSCSSDEAGVVECTLFSCHMVSGTHYLYVSGDGHTGDSPITYSVALDVTTSATIQDVRNMEIVQVTPPGTEDPRVQFRINQRPQTFGTHLRLLGVPGQRPCTDIALYTENPFPCGRPVLDHTILDNEGTQNTETVYVLVEDMFPCTFRPVWTDSPATVVDLTGSAVVDVNGTVEVGTVNRYMFDLPRPMQLEQDIYIAVTSPSGHARVTVYDAMKAWQQDADIPAAATEFELSNCDISSRPYFVDVTAAGAAVTEYTVHFHPVTIISTPDLENHVPACVGISAAPKKHVFRLPVDDWSAMSYFELDVAGDIGDRFSAFVQTNRIPSRSCRIASCEADVRGRCHLYTSCGITAGDDVIISVVPAHAGVNVTVTAHVWTAEPIDLEPGVSTGDVVFSASARPRFYRTVVPYAANYTVDFDGPGFETVRGMNRLAVNTVCSATSSDLSFCGTTVQYITVFPPRTIAPTGARYSLMLSTEESAPTRDPVVLHIEEGDTEKVSFRSVGGEDGESVFVRVALPEAFGGNVLHASLSSEPEVDIASEVVISYAESTEADAPICSMTFTDVASNGLITPHSCAGYVVVRMTVSADCRVDFTVALTWQQGIDVHVLDLENDAAVVDVNAHPHSSVVFAVKSPRLANECMYVVFDNPDETVLHLPHEILHSVRGAFCAKTDAAGSFPIMGDDYETHRAQLLLFPMSGIDTHYLRMQNADFPYRIKVGFTSILYTASGERVRIGDSSREKGFTKGDTLSLTTTAISLKSPEALSTVIDTLSFSSTEHSAQKYVDVLVFGIHNDNVMVHHTRRCMGYSVGAGDCRFDLSSEADLHMDRTLGAVNEYHYMVMGYYDYSAAIRISAGRRTCKSVAAVGIPVDHICYDVFRGHHDYHVWSGLDADMAVGNAWHLYKMYAAEYAANCPTSTCLSSIRRLACFEAFRRCDDAGFLHGTCRSACTDVSVSCEAPTGMVDEVFRGRQCGASRYDDTAACSGVGSFDRRKLTTCPNDCSGNGRCVYGYCICDNASLLSDCSV